MKAVVRTGPGELELNWTWLPTWIGMNGALKKEIEDALKSKLEGQPMDEELANQMVMDFLVVRFPKVLGLYDYLDGLKYIELR